MRLCYVPGGGPGGVDAGWSPDADDPNWYRGIFHTGVPSLDIDSKTCVWEKQTNGIYKGEEFELGTLALSGLPYLQDLQLQITASDSAGNDVTCDATVVIDAPRLGLSRTNLAVTTLLTSSDRTDLTIMNTGTEELTLRTGSPHGMAFLNGNFTSNHENLRSHFLF